MCHTGHNPHDDTSDEAPIVCDLDASTLEVSYIGNTNRRNFLFPDLYLVTRTTYVVPSPETREFQFVTVGLRRTHKPHISIISPQWPQSTMRNPEIRPGPRTYKASQPCRCCTLTVFQL